MNFRFPLMLILCGAAFAARPLDAAAHRICELMNHLALDRDTAVIADAVRASKAGQDPSTAARLAAQAVDTQRLPTQAAAAAMCEDSLARGVRPRAILTVDGWYTHPEMARTKAPGVAALGGQA